jgi:Amt family ammonium transporter
MKVDDPVGAVAVHGMCGALGTILVGIFAVDGGLLYGGGAGMLVTQIVGVVAVIAWVGITMTIIFKVINNTIGLRVPAEEEIAGLDVVEHGLLSSYADFMPSVAPFSTSNEGMTAIHFNKASVDEAIPVEVIKNATNNGVKINKVVIVINQNRFQPLKEAMNEIGVAGMTVINVLGCGVQKGYSEYYRGVKVEMNLLPKIQVEIVVSKVPARTVIETAKKVLYTGHIGDGKIFVYDVENVVKIRTGEEGYDALQDENEELAK